ncbi:MAG: winged helix-turn-helix domain-containing protein [Armatimonadetes bacterium]|nr:winged helix-turn-helix domain-containing protein [Armatimonadota bacterium]MDW8121764.1 winged helix-turn-helix domain-containing protein [Armatimonadota bacterium]
MLRRDRLERAVSALMNKLETLVAGVREQVVDRIRKGEYEEAQSLVARAQGVESFVNSVRQSYEQLIAGWEEAPTETRQRAPRAARAPRVAARRAAAPRTRRAVRAAARPTRAVVARPAAARRAPAQAAAVSAARERLPRGTATPQSAYRLPILKALADLGGQAPAHQVLSRVFEQMKDSLKPEDLERLPYARNRPRWQTYCRWERNKLLADGLLRRDAPRGQWALSDKGRQFLKQHA